VLGVLAPLAVVTVVRSAQQQQRPNIVVIVGDDIGWMQPSIYHRGLMVGETPNIDRIGQEGAILMDYVAMQKRTISLPGNALMLLGCEENRCKSRWSRRDERSDGGNRVRSH